ncbi:hypothetical protein QE152_g7934 [Popillia japonica]|uniref:Uncharacterized protein n=1 Tax=Popillia japonica TaxID=7064 RepID=A0AAW1MEW5_POPJA
MQLRRYYGIAARWMITAPRFLNELHGFCRRYIHPTKELTINRLAWLGFARDQRQLIYPLYTSDERTNHKSVSLVRIRPGSKTTDLRVSIIETKSCDPRRGTLRREQVHLFLDPLSLT